MVSRLPIVSPDNRVVRPGTWDSTSVRVVTSPARNRIYMLFELDDFPSSIGIRSYDLDTLLETGYSTFRGRWQGQYHGALAHPTDGLLFYKTDDDEITILDEDLISASRDPVVRRLTIPPEQRALLVPVENDVFAARIDTFSFARRDGRDKLIVAYKPAAGWVAGSSGGAVGTTLPFLAQWDVQTGAGDWLHPINSCRDGRDFEPAGIYTMLSRDGRSLYTVCYVSGALAGVLRIPLGEDGGPDDSAEVEVFPGPVEVVRLFMDESAERVLMIAQGGGTAGHQLWVFDGGSSRYAGVSGLTQGPNRASFGFDPTTGRLYVQTHDHFVRSLQSLVAPGGLAMVDTRLTPVPQPVTFAWMSRPSDISISVFPSAPARPTTVFVRRAGGAERGPGSKRSATDPDCFYRYPDAKRMCPFDERFFRVLEDTVPLGRQPTLGVLDRLTIDVDEGKGVTTSSYEASGTGYGARVQMVGGLGAALRVSSIEPFEYGLDRAGYLPACWQTRRDLVAGVVNDSRLSNFEASAQSQAASANEATLGDLEGPSDRCAPAQKPPDIDTGAVDGVIGQSWSHPLVECSGDREERVGSAPQDAFAAATMCSFSEGKAAAHAYTSGLTGGEVSVARTESTVEVQRDPDRGVVVVSRAAASGVALPGGVSIGLVESVAEVWSNGRPAGERATLERRFCFVRASGYEQQGCRDPSEAIAAMNRAFGRRGRISTPAPDADFAKGTPLGYAAGITKDRFAVVDETLLNADTRLEVPALEITFYRDSTYYGAGRQIIQLAGVQAVATYGISCVPPYGFDGEAADCAEVQGSAPPQRALSGPTQGSNPLPESNDTPVAQSPATGETRQILGPVEVIKDLLIRGLGEGLLLTLVWLTLGAPFVLAARRARAASVGRT